MSSMVFVGGVIVLVLAASVIFVIVNGRKGSADKKAEFKSKRFLTENELEFIHRLETAAPEFRFCPQVAMGAILDPNISRKEDSKNFFRLRGMFAQKIVDFVVQDKQTGRVLAVIELDDRTHVVEKDQKRDAMLKEAGYNVIRWNSKSKPSIEIIRREILALASPNSAQKVEGTLVGEVRVKALDAKDLPKIEPSLNGDSEGKIGISIAQPRKKSDTV